jgi:hypothetical protein
MILSVIGLDPGETTGMCFLNYYTFPDDTWNPIPERILLQAEGSSSDHVLRAMLHAYYPAGNTEVTARYAGIERFVTGRAAGGRTKPGEITRQLVMQLAETCQLYGYSTKLRSASEVKPWATDKRLVKAQIAREETALHGKARDAYDGARHALFAAVADAKMKDPLARVRTA